MDVVYPLKENNFDNLEIRYSLRSIERNLKFDKVIIIGHLPEFIKDVYYIPFDDKKKYQLDKFYKLRNVREKLKIITNLNIVSDDFIWMNDDFYLMKKKRTIPYYYKYTLKEMAEKHQTKAGYYYQTILNSIEKFGEEMKSFEVHCPIIFNKKKMKKVLKKTEGDKMVFFRTAYCYYHNIEGKKIDDCKVYHFKDLKRFMNSPFLSSSDEVIGDRRFVWFLKARFPDKSRFEK